MVLSSTKSRDHNGHEKVSKAACRPARGEPGPRADPGSGVLGVHGMRFCRYLDARNRHTRPRFQRELYAEFDSKQDMLVACIRARAERLKLPVDLPDIGDRANLERALVAFGTQLLREVSDPTVVAVFRLAISEAFRAPEVAHALNDVAFATSRGALREIMRRAAAAGLVDGEPADMAEQFFGLLWGSKLLGLLLNINERPSVREIAVRAEKAASAFLLAH